MNLRKLLILSSLVFVITGCQKTPKQPSESSHSEESKETEESEGSIVSEEGDSEEENFEIIERAYSYENRLEEPSSIVSNIAELAAFVDYHAFYKDVRQFDVTISEDYVYSAPQKKAYNEGCYLYWRDELVNGVMGISLTEKNQTTWTVDFTFYENAVIDGNPTTSMFKDLSYVEPTSDRSEDYNGFATEDEFKPVVDVASSQQLWYAAEHGYRINALSGSPAEHYYNEAKKILKSIIKDDMSDYQKADTIYNYITHHASYCYEALDLPESEDPVNYPDKYCAPHKAFFLEGFFDNHTVVCDGYSKVYTLLGRMEGLHILRGSGTSDHSWITKEVAGHAYCYVEIDDKYYLSCPTWGQMRLTENKFIVSQTYFLNTRAHMDDNYPCSFWKEYEYADEPNYMDEFKGRFINIDENQYSMYIPLGKSYSPLINYFKNLAENSCYVEIYFASSGQVSSFKNELPKSVKSYQTSANTICVIKL